MSQHARLSPSAASRWISCPASIRLSDQVHDTPSESPYANEGTLAHEGAEIAASYKFGLINSDDYLTRFSAWRVKVGDEDTIAEMQTHINGYVSYLDSIRSEENGLIRLEQRFDTGVPYCWGTSDATLVSPTHLDVVDLKYGAGIRVSAEDNSQLKLYALGAVRAYWLLSPIKTVTTHIYQPRMNNISSWTISVEELHDWRDEVVVPAAKMAVGWDAPFNPSEQTCRFCPAAGVCRARSDYMAQVDFGQPDLLTPAELADKFGMLKEIRDWCADVEAYVLDLAYEQQVKVPGYKVVLSGGRRTVPDAPAAIQILMDAGFTPEQVARTSLRPFRDLEKLVGKNGLEDVLGDLIVKSTGRPSVVPETDKRAEVSRVGEAQHDFGLQHDT